jgi:hypothetical protein
MEHIPEPAPDRAQASPDNHERPPNRIPARDEPGDLLRQTGSGIPILADMQAKPTVDDVVQRDDVADKRPRPDDVPVHGGREARCRSKERGKHHFPNGTPGGSDLT